MSDAKELEKQIAELQEKLQKSEKLSSLGMLSAGVAHEVKNPLNFIINFSKMIDVMLGDLEDVLEEKNINLDDPDNEEISEIIADIRTNLEKINEHGRKATDIIQGILSMSRGQEDMFIPTNIPQMLKEYVWLSYHSMRANHTGFNVAIHEDYDISMPDIKVIPPDFCRVIINLMNNACYAVWKKQQDGQNATYAPTIDVAAGMKGDYMTITVEDNGIGMSDEVKAKLFHAFFTTKETGEGTGLGLTITREIVEQKHKGSITVESEEGKFTRFTISIPTNL